MHMQTPSVQPISLLAPQNAKHDSVARTMSSFDLLVLVNEARMQHGESEVRRADFTARCKDELDGEYYETFVVKNSRGPASEGLMLTKDQCLLVSMRESKAVRRIVVQKLNELSQPRELTRLELIQLAYEAEQARVLLTVQVEAQAKKIDHLENLFKEGMSHVQFCKGLNGVNVMQVGHFLEGRNWLYNESKSGTRYRVAAYARDKYMTEHQQEITPHGKEAFISYTPILLRKGAVRLYELYLAGELPMKKNWDGLHTHDKAVRGAA
ncbi:transporter [Pseudomonas monteilii]|nr:MULTISPECIES: transporter [Pseudomonas]AYN15482.1 transporter [Pseudomonas monteilii]AYO00858.1 transporter [Pseudomonas sp. LTGT-11-2Z]MBF8732832.1 transporter [Pseudomonas guariconensis]